MQILVLGATGKTGRHIVRQALDAGHSVTALVRDPARVEQSHEKLSLVKGDVLNPDAVQQCFAPRPDAVISALGMFHREPMTVISDGTGIVLDAMQRSGCQRIIVISSVGAGDSKGQGTLIVKFFQSVMLKHVIADKNRQEKLVQDSGLDWTIIRPPQLVDQEPKTDRLVTWQGNGLAEKVTWRTTCHAVARCALAAATEGQYLNQAINVSDPK